MNVWIKQFDVKMEVKTKGMELEVKDTNERQMGDLVITKAHLIWCSGRTGRNNGKKISWKDFIDYMESR